MSQFVTLSEAELEKILEQHNLLSKMHSDKLLAKEQAKSPAKKSLGGTSYIITYYDEHIQNYFTIHRIISQEGKVIHEHVKSAYIDGVKYRVKST
jgi:hypothetical protein